MLFYKILNLDASPPVYIRYLGRQSFSKKVADRMAADFRNRGYTVRVEPNSASHEAMATRKSRRPRTGTAHLAHAAAHGSRKPVRLATPGEKIAMDDNARRLLANEVGRTFPGPGGDEYTVRAILSPKEMIAQNMVTDELVGFYKEKGAAEPYWSAVRYFGLKEYPGFSSSLPEAIARWKAPTKVTHAPKPKPRWEPDEDFDLEQELETGYVIGDARGPGYFVTCEQRSCGGTFESIVAALQFIEGKMKKDGYCPGIFYVNERGNTELLSPKKRFGKVYDYDVLHGWV